MKLNPTRVTVVAFDLFGTVFDARGHGTREEFAAYAAHIAQPEWSPLKLPEHWATMPAFLDSAPGIAQIRESRLAVTCSNAPAPLTVEMSRNAGIDWDCIIPLEVRQTYKTRPESYLLVCDLLDVPPASVLMVTANEHFGDLEASRALGMQAILIRGEDGPKDIMSLAELLEAA